MRNDDLRMMKPRIGQHKASELRTRRVRWIPSILPSWCIARLLWVPVSACTVGEGAQGEGAQEVTPREALTRDLWALAGDEMEGLSSSAVAPSRSTTHPGTMWI